MRSSVLRLQAHSRTEHVHPARSVLLRGDLDCVDQMKKRGWRRVFLLLTRVAEEDEVLLADILINSPAVVPLSREIDARVLGVVIRVSWNINRRRKDCLGQRDGA